jgi:hypothetical protein
VAVVASTVIAEPMMARIGHRHVVLTDVHAVGTRRQRHVDPIV